MNTRTIGKLVVTLAVAAAAAASAHAQPYPAKTVRIVVPYPPAGGVDIMARLLAAKMGERHGVQFIVENRAGAGTIVGTELSRVRRPTVIRSCSRIPD